MAALLLARCIGSRPFRAFDVVRAPAARLHLADLATTLTSGVIAACTALICSMVVLSIVAAVVIVGG